MYNRIQHPRTRAWVTVDSPSGAKILHKYLARQQTGGASTEVNSRKPLNNLVLTGLIRPDERILGNFDHGSGRGRGWVDPTLMRFLNMDLSELFGTYTIVAGRTLNNRGVWELDSHPGRYLFYTASGKWIISSENYLTESQTPYFWFSVTSDAITPDKITETWTVVDKETQILEVPLVSVMLRDKYDSIVHTSNEVGDVQFIRVWHQPSHGRSESRDHDGLLQGGEYTLYFTGKYSLIPGLVVNSHPVWQSGGDEHYYLFFANSRFRGPSWWISKGRIHPDGRGILHVESTAITPDQIGINIWKIAGKSTHTWESIGSLEIMKTTNYTEILTQTQQIGPLVIRGFHDTVSPHPNHMDIFYPISDIILHQHGIWKSRETNQYLYWSSKPLLANSGHWSIGIQDTPLNISEGFNPTDIIVSAVTDGSVSPVQAEDWTIHDTVSSDNLLAGLNIIKVGKASSIDEQQYTRRLKLIEQGKLQLLHLAKRSNPADLKRVGELIDFGVDVNSLSPKGRSALCLAAVYGRSPMIIKLISLGADLEGNIPTSTFAAAPTSLSLGAQKMPDTPLVLSILNGHLASTKVLVEAGAIIPDGIIQLLVICNQVSTIPNSSPMLEYLLYQGLDPNQDSTGTLYLYYVKELPYIPFKITSKLITTLVKGGCDVNHLDKYQCSALWWAADRSYYKIAKKLLDLGANPDIHTTYRPFEGIQLGGAIHRAAVRRDTKMITLLVDGGANINNYLTQVSSPHSQDFSISRTDIIKTRPLLYAILGLQTRQPGVDDITTTLRIMFKLGAVVFPDDVRQSGLAHGESTVITDLLQNQLDSKVNQLNLLIIQIDMATTSQDLLTLLESVNLREATLTDGEFSRLQASFGKYITGANFSELWTQPVAQEYGTLLRQRHPVNRMRHQQLSSNSEYQDTILQLAIANQILTEARLGRGYVSATAAQQQVSRTNTRLAHLREQLGIRDGPDTISSRLSQQLSEDEALESRRVDTGSDSVTASDLTFQSSEL